MVGNLNYPPIPKDPGDQLSSILVLSQKSPHLQYLFDHGPSEINMSCDTTGFVRQKFAEILCVRVIFVPRPLHYPNTTPTPIYNPTPTPNPGSLIVASLLDFERENIRSA